MSLWVMSRNTVIEHKFSAPPKADMPGHQWKPYRFWPVEIGLSESNLTRRRTVVRVSPATDNVCVLRDDRATTDQWPFRALQKIE